MGVSGSPDWGPLTEARQWPCNINEPTETLVYGEIPCAADVTTRTRLRHRRSSAGDAGNGATADALPVHSGHSA